MNSAAPIPFSFGAIILAAGASSRMGRPKMLLPWGESTVIGHLIAQWRSVGAMQIGIVCAADHESIHAELDRVGFAREERIINPAPARGMFSSIQCAAQWTGWNPGLRHWAIALGDQPHLADATLRTVAAVAAQHPDRICQPARNGRPRHPVFLPKPLFEQLAASTHATFKEFLQAHAPEMQLVEVTDVGLDRDLDTPADYEKMRVFVAPP